MAHAPDRLRFLFGLRCDTVTEIGLLVIAAGACRCSGSLLVGAALPLSAHLR